MTEVQGKQHDALDNNIDTETQADKEEEKKTESSAAKQRSPGDRGDSVERRRLPEDGREEVVDEVKSEDLIPCVFTWSHGGHNVYLTGTFNNWSTEAKITLVRSGHEFSAVKPLPRGVHLYKFIVDNQWKYAPDQQTESDERRNINNVLDISNFQPSNFYLTSQYEQARIALYHQYVPEHAEFTADAPSMPILLSKSTCMAAEGSGRTGVPLLCICNHVYHDAQGTNLFGPHVSIVAATQRWRVENRDICAGQKYGTYIYVTLNPLFPISADPVSNYLYATTNPLRQLLKPRASSSSSTSQQQGTPIPTTTSSCSSTGHSSSSPAAASLSSYLLSAYPMISPYTNPYYADPLRQQHLLARRSFDSPFSRVMVQAPSTASGSPEPAVSCLSSSSLSLNISATPPAPQSRGN